MIIKKEKEQILRKEKEQILRKEKEKETLQQASDKTTPPSFLHVEEQ